MRLDLGLTKIDHLLADTFGPSVYVIGGPVRDALRHHFHGSAFEPKDKDYVIIGHTLADIQKGLSAFGRIGFVGASFGILKFTMPDEPTVDIALPRRERSTGWGHRDFDIESGPAISLEEDQARRDFLMNAVALQLITGEVIAHPGAIEDIKARRITAINGRRSFEEDPLRMLRAAQFAARFDFDIEADTLALMRECAPLIRAEPPVSPERIAEEFNKLLVKSDRPSIGLRILKVTGLLALTIPELQEAVGVEQNRFHAFDVFDHTLAVVDASRQDLTSRWAALLHDIGKPRARSEAPGPNGYTFYEHEDIGAQMARSVLAGLRFPNEFIERVARLVSNHMYKADPNLSEKAIKRFINRIGVDLICDQLALRHADKAGKGPGASSKGEIDAAFEARVHRILAEKPPLAIKDLALNGHDVINAIRTAGLRPQSFAGGPEVGQILRDLHDKVLDDPALNTKERLYRELHTLIVEALSAEP